MHTRIGLILLLLLAATPAWAGRNAFVDPVNGVLKAHGFVDANAPGDLVLPVEEEFNLAPGRWRWTGSEWLPFAPPPIPQNPALVAFRNHVNAVLGNPLIPQGIKDVLNAIKDLR